jgi:hypothetical protein
MVVPADATVGGYLQASVSRDGKEYHFSVVVPEGAIPGVTTLTVPVPIPKASATQPAVAQAGAAAFPMAAMPPGMAPPPPSAGPGGEQKGMDVVASYLMDRGVDAGAAIDAAGKCAAAGLDSASLLRDADPAFLQRVSGLSLDQLHRVLSHRDPADVNRALGGGGSSSSSYGGSSSNGYGSSGYGDNGGSGMSSGVRRYSIDQLDDEDDEPLMRSRS